MSSRVRICTGADVSVSVRLMLEPVTSIRSTFWACCAPAAAEKAAATTDATMAGTALLRCLIVFSRDELFFSVGAQLRPRKLAQAPRLGPCGAGGRRVFR